MCLLQCLNLTTAERDAVVVERIDILKDEVAPHHYKVTEMILNPHTIP